MTEHTFLTDTWGIPTAAFPVDEPAPGSVALTDGPRGTAWQLHSDGRWHSTSKGIIRWEKLSKRRRLVLVYLAPAVEENAA